jgi:sorbitol-specific phosphotransferase system component IIC
MLGTYTLTIHSTLTPTLVLAESQTENIVRMVTQDNVLIPTLIAGSIIVVVTVNMIGKEQGERLMKAGERASS